MKQRLATNVSRVMVIGAGVAGSTAAIRFAHLGCDVTLVERATFPREKICGCCLGAAGLNALDAIGLGNAVRDLGTPTHTFVGYLQTQRCKTSMSSPLVCQRPIRLATEVGVAISRGSLDSMLIQQAAAAGVKVWQPYDAQIVDADATRTFLRYRSIDDQAFQEWQYTDEYDLVVVASGLSGVFVGSLPHEGSESPARRWRLPWIESPHGPFGIAAHLPATHPLANAWGLLDGEIQMVCGDEGYVGLVRLPDGEIDIASALRASQPAIRSSGQDDAVSGESVRSNKPTSRLLTLLTSHPELPGSMHGVLADWLNHEATLMTAPQLRRKRLAGRDRVVAIGDCAGYVEPLTGEGMTWGIETGLAVADLWTSSQRPVEFASQWQARLESLQRKRRILCSGVTRAMRVRALRRVARFGLIHAPWLAGPMTRSLARGPSFASSH
jgi:flavin-dependent dehydrogenase